MEIFYFLMDGRANYDIDRAFVLRTCQTLDEAKSHINDYGADTCIVEIDGQKQTLIYSLLWGDDNQP